MSEIYKVGDLVRLKSGGPKMTVNSINSVWIDCAWFTGSKANRENFKPEALERYKEEEEKVATKGS